MHDILEFDKLKDLLAIIAPASSGSDAIKMLKEKCVLLESFGFKLWFNEKKMFASDSLPFFAAKRETRLKQLKEALLHPEIKAIWCFRGGYGSTEILFDCLNLTLPCSKILLGFSDITAIHLLFNQVYKLPSLHSEVLTRTTNENIQEILDALNGATTNFKLKPLNLIAENSYIEGKLMGGNLTVFCNMLGTEISPKTADYILIFEDIGEKGYKIHRDLVHLEDARIFEQAKAVIFGDFTDGDENVEPAINDFIANHLTIPVYRAEGFGHGPINHPLALGCMAEINDAQLIVKNPFKLI